VSGARVRWRKAGGLHGARFYGYTLVLPAIALLIFFFFIPSFYNVELSFHKISLFETVRGRGKFVGLENFAKLIRDPEFYNALKNTTFWLTGATVGLRLLLGFVLALLLNSTALKRWRLADVGRILVFIPWGVPPVVAVTIWKWMLHSRYGVVNLIFQRLGLIQQPIFFLTDTSVVWISIILVIVWRELPFAVVTFLAGLQSIPQELYEVARIDGAGWFHELRYITIPLLKPVITIVAFMITIWTFNNFVYVWLFTRGGPGNFTHVLGTKVYFESFVNYKIGYGATFGVIMTVIMMVFALVYFSTLFKRSVNV